MADDQYFLYENRLASFHGPQSVTKRRQSNASSKAPKTLAWPHKFLRAEDLARAGFYFNPSSLSPDNVECFLCYKALDGWEEGDDPALEHVKHAPACGWAVVAAIEAEVGELGKVDPRDPRMMEARKATFAGRWPHEKRKGWKCKTKQLVEAGWKYTPTLDSDDNTTCTYCQLALDGWEAGDKPMDEHSRRAPDCPFFQLINSLPAPPKKTGRSKAARGSAASRLSIQSLATAVSDLTSVADLAADVDDSVLTTTSTMTQGKKAVKGRKAATGTKGRGKSRAKKDEAVEVLEDAPAPSQDEAIPPPPPPKPARGKKRGSDAMDDSVVTNAEAPAPKKRATRAARTSNVADDELSVAEPAPPLVRKVSGRKKARTSTTATMSNRKGSGASIMSTASTASLRAHALDDDELDRQLQADLERPLTDDEDVLMDSDAERRREPARQAKSKKTYEKQRSAASQKGVEQKDVYAMFDPATVDHDDAQLEAELQALQTKMEVEGEDEKLSVPKKGRKAGPRKVSKQTKTKKGQQSEAAAAAVPSLELPGPLPELEQVAHDMSVASNATVVQANPVPVKRGRGRPPKQSQEAKATHPLTGTTAGANETEAESTVIGPPQTAVPPPARINKSLPPPPATPRAYQVSPAPSARQPVLSPSQSPQSSDAENQPPSSKPATSATTKRVALAPLPVLATPVRNGSPSKRNVIAGLQSTTPWAMVDLDLVFCGSPGGAAAPTATATAERENGIDRLLRKGTELTSPEKGMTVEEWIYQNAGLAEQKLKGECEATVSAFEREGGRAMGVLEGLVVE